MDRADFDRSGTMRRYIEIIHDLGLPAQFSGKGRGGTHGVRTP